MNKVVPETYIEKDALAYLKKRKIVELFDNMLAILMFERPLNPRLYLASFLEQLNLAMATCGEEPCLINESNIKSLFNMLDITGTGFVSNEQYEQAMKTLGIKKYESCKSLGLEFIDYETFHRNAVSGLCKTWKTFYVPGEEEETEGEETEETEETTVEETVDTGETD